MTDIMELIKRAIRLNYLIEKYSDEKDQDEFKDVTYQIQSRISAMQEVVDKAIKYKDKSGLSVHIDCKCHLCDLLRAVDKLEALNH